MTDTVTLELPHELAESARTIAERTNRRVEDVLLEWLDRAVADVPISLLPDDKVLALCDLRMSDEQQEELSDLLGRQREGTLDSAGRARLVALMSLYRGGMVRKAEALKVAVGGVRTEGPMAPDIPLSGQRPAEYVFARHVQQKLAEIEETEARAEKPVAAE